ncbi:MAG: RNA 2',3'-cyclic phosphodiesterase [Planctomycetota bacterium]|nr:RNA 2',3'-cyclic phosphodiesterase [Planctomycetota bacterium]
MRLFLGIFPPPQVLREVGRISGRLKARPGLASGRHGPRWTKEEAWHLTLAFLGEQEPDVVPRILAAAGPLIASTAAFSCALEGVGGFPNGDRARVLWLGVGAGREALLALASSVSGLLAGLGLGVGEAPFHPHLTLARSGRGPLRVPAMAASATAFRVREVALVHSHLASSGAAYEVLERLPLA